MKLLTTVAAVSTGRTTLRRWERGGVPEMSTKLIVKFHNSFPAHIAHLAVAELCAGAGRIDHGLDQQVTESSVRDQDHRGYCPAEQEPRREDQEPRWPYPECVGQFGCASA